MGRGGELQGGGMAGKSASPHVHPRQGEEETSVSMVPFALGKARCLRSGVDGVADGNISDARERSTRLPLLRARY